MVLVDIFIKALQTKIISLENAPFWNKIFISYMGTDSICIFNKKLADSIMSMQFRDFAEFIKDRIDSLKRIEVPRSAFLYEIESADKFNAKDFDRDAILRRAFEERENVVLDLCLSEEEVYLDYWGTTFGAFETSDPEGAISIGEFLPSFEDEPFLMLLQPAHVESILQSLEKHRDELTVMDCEAIEKVREIKDLCTNNPEMTAAYIIDF